MNLLLTILIFVGIILATNTFFGFIGAMASAVVNKRDANFNSSFWSLIITAIIWSLFYYLQ